MPKEINLLPRRNKGILEQENTIVIARVIAIFSVIFVLSSGIGAFFLSKNYSLSAIQAEQSAVQSKFQLLSAKTTRILTLSDRMRHIQNILQKRQDLTAKITTIQKKLPQGVTITSLSLSSQSISLSANSKSLTALQNFLNELTAMVSQKQLLQQLTIDNVSVDVTTGLYTVNVKGAFL